MQTPGCRIIIALLLLLTALPATLWAATPEAIGEVSSLKGSVVAVAAGQRRTLEEKSPVYLRDVIATSADSQVSLTFKDGSVVQLQEASQITVDEYVYNPANASSCKTVLRAIMGFVRVATGAIVKENPGGFNFKTKLANLGIRGTDFFANLEPTGEDIGVYDMDGGHRVEVWTEKARLTIEKPGYFTRVGTDGTLSPLAPIPKNLVRTVVRAQHNLLRQQMRPPSHRP